MRGLNLYGYSRQTQTTGAQLIPYPYYRKTSIIDGLSFVVNPDESVVVNGTCTAESYTAFLVSIQGNLNLANGSYYLTGCPSGGSTQTFYMQLNNYDGAHTKFDTGSGVQIDFQNAGGEYDVAIIIRSGYTANNLVFKPMLNAGSSPLPWEPYSGGYASPSPDWAQPIHSVGDGGSVTVESQGANLVNPYNRNSASLSVTESGGMYHLNKGSGPSAVLAFSVDGFAHIFKKYSTLKAIVKIKTDAAGQGVINDIYPDSFSNDVQLNPSTTMEKKTSTINLINNALEKTYANYRIFTTSDGTVTVAKDIMVNAGSTSLPYIPYAAPSSALITLTDSLRGIPVTSGGTYTDDDGQQWIADYIYRRQTDGKWCLWRNIKCAEYDGSTDEVWNVSVGGDNIFTTSDFSGVPLNGLCNRFRYKNNPESAGEFEFDASHSFRFYTDLNGVPAWRTWLQSNPLEVVYRLATPTIEELPENVQTELNGLYTYNLHTDMWNNDGAYMGLKYVADTKTWINNKIAGLSTAMLNQN